MKNTSIAKVFLIINITLAILIIIFAVNSYYLYDSGKKIVQLKDYYLNVYNYTNEITNSSNEFTKMARAYVSTGNKKFLSNYQKLQGKIGRKNDGRTGIISLDAEHIAIMNNTKEEKAKLIEAKQFEIQLREIDQAAFNALEGIYDDGYGNYIVKGEPDTIFARELLFASNYFSTTQSMIQPIEDFKNMVNRRNENAISKIEKLSFAQGISLDILNIFILLIIAISYVIIHRKVVRPIEALEEFSEKISLGKYDFKLRIFYSDEIGKLTTAFNRMLEGIKEKADFVNQIRTNNLNIKLKPLSDDDNMAHSLIEMRNSLINNQKKEEEQIEKDRQRNWATEGLAKFADILRQNNDDSSKLSQNIISNLVKYMGVNQGGLYVLNESNSEDKFVEMTACYAFDRIRRQQVRLSTEEGLIGRALYERNTLYLTDIPDSYITITSGLGEAPPSTLLIVLLKLNDNILGLVEIASFNKIPRYKIEFVEKLGESIAATLSTAKVNEQTTILLRESREQAEVLAAQEEEMMQNIEELQVTQETLDKKDKEQKNIIEKLNSEKQKHIQDLNEHKIEATGILNALNNTVLMFELDIDGNIKFVTNYIKKICGLNPQEFVGRNHWDFVHSDNVIDQNKKEKINGELKRGITVEITSKIQINEKVFWCLETLTPVLDENANIKKIIKISKKITNDKKKEFSIVSITNIIDNS